MDELITKLTRIIPRPDGSEVRIVAQAYFGAGLHRSVGVDVFRRASPGHDWALCSDRPHPDWLNVKSRLVINALLEQFRFFGVPVFQGLNR